MYPWTEYQTNLVKTQTQTPWIPEFQQQGHCLTQYNNITKFLTQILYTYILVILILYLYNFTISFDSVKLQY